MNEIVPQKPEPLTGELLGGKDTTDPQKLCRELANAVNDIVCSTLVDALAGDNFIPGDEFVERMARRMLAKCDGYIIMKCQPPISTPITDPNPYKEMLGEK